MLHDFLSWGVKDYTEFFFIEWVEDGMIEGGQNWAWPLTNISYLFIDDCSGQLYIVFDEHPNGGEEIKPLE